MDLENMVNDYHRLNGYLRDLELTRAEETGGSSKEDINKTWYERGEELGMNAISGADSQKAANADKMAEEIKEQENYLLKNGRFDPAALKSVLDNPQSTPEERKTALDKYQDQMNNLMGAMYSGGIIPTFDGGAAYVSIPTPEQIRAEEARRVAQQKASEATWRAIGQAAGAISNAINQSQSGSQSYHPSGGGHYHPSGDR